MHFDKLIILRSTKYIIVCAALLWIILALISFFVKLSSLQITWSYESKLIIFLLFPTAVLAGIISVINDKVKLKYLSNHKSDKWIKYSFYIIYIIFVLQCFYSTPPGLSPNPNIARLDWGMKYLHVITEILIRISLINFLSISICNGRFDRITKVIIILSIIYSLLVVTRSFLLEIIFYIIISQLIINYKNGKTIFNLRIILAVVIMITIFVVYGNLRQGDQFLITEYAMIDIDSSFVGWIFGYFLINFDNLALIINEGFKNNAFSNIFGSIIQTLQISEFTHVHDYLYVGRFNIGTALRPYILDYGYLTGVLTFGIIWIVTLLIPRFTITLTSRYSCLLLISYMAFCFPITSRIEQPPYIFPFLFFAIIRDIRYRI
jgi:oligosaccharide repeat unit polymerase